MRNLILMIMIVCTSCGSKKRAVQINKTKTEENRDVVLKQKNDILSSILVNKLDTRISFEPIDPNDPIILNDTTSIKNARVVIRNIKTDSSATITDKTIVDVIDKTKTSVEKKDKNVQMEREGFNWKGLKTALIWLAIVLIIAIVGYLKITGRKIFNRN